MGLANGRRHVVPPLSGGGAPGPEEPQHPDEDGMLHDLRLRPLQGGGRRDGHQHGRHAGHARVVGARGAPGPGVLNRRGVHGGCVQLRRDRVGDPLRAAAVGGDAPPAGRHHGHPGEAAARDPPGLPARDQGAACRVLRARPGAAAHDGGGGGGLPRTGRADARVQGGVHARAGRVHALQPAHPPVANEHRGRAHAADVGRRGDAYRCVADSLRRLGPHRPRAAGQKDDNLSGVPFVKK
mmetsp:Transcript_67371/g.161073  ORF Transcript_67371/g.161073 Transcript_67371/m.161073 type:complete len:239 (+) Transcript_67371:690-1406(+)